MTLNRQVHFLIDPEQYLALEELARTRWKATGKRVTLGTLLREAVADYLARHRAASINLWTPIRKRPKKTT